MISLFKLISFTTETYSNMYLEALDVNAFFSYSLEKEKLPTSEIKKKTVLYYKPFKTVVKSY